MGYARHYSEHTFAKFLESWALLPEVAAKARHSRLQVLQRALEIEEYVNFVQTLENYDAIEPIQRLTEVWLSRYPSDIRDEIDVWSTLIAQRVHLLGAVLRNFATYW